MLQFDARALKLNVAGIFHFKLPFHKTINKFLSVLFRCVGRLRDIRETQILTSGVDILIEDAVIFSLLAKISFAGVSPFTTRSIIHKLSSFVVQNIIESIWNVIRFF